MHLWSYRSTNATICGWWYCWICFHFCGEGDAPSLLWLLGSTSQQASPWLRPRTTPPFFQVTKVLYGQTGSSITTVNVGLIRRHTVQLTSQYAFDDNVDFAGIFVWEETSFPCYNSSAALVKKHVRGFDLRLLQYCFRSFGRHKIFYMILTIQYSLAEKMMVFTWLMAVCSLVVVSTLSCVLFILSDLALSGLWPLHRLQSLSVRPQKTGCVSLPYISSSRTCFGDMLCWTHCQSRQCRENASFGGSFMK